MLKREGAFAMWPTNWRAGNSVCAHVIKGNDTPADGHASQLGHGREHCSDSGRPMEAERPSSPRGSDSGAMCVRRCARCLGHPRNGTSVCGHSAVSGGSTRPAGPPNNHRADAELLSVWRCTLQAQQGQATVLLIVLECSAVQCWRRWNNSEHAQRHLESWDFRGSVPWTGSGPAASSGCGTLPSELCMCIAP